MKIFSPRRLLILYFIGMSFAFLWLIGTGIFCQNEVVDDTYYEKKSSKGIFKEMAGLQLKLEKREQEFAVKEKQLKNLVNELKSKNCVHIKGSKSDDVVLDIPIIYVITPTYARPEQKAELTRLVQTFLHVRNLHWILVEDSAVKTPLVTKLLAQSGLQYTHLHEATPSSYKLEKTDPNWLKPRGVLQRNQALAWIRKNVNPTSVEAGVVYFADDDNTYDIKLFDEMRYTKKVSVWPVGLVGKLRYEAPIVTNGKVTGWFTYWYPNRPFACDMAGFALNFYLIFAKPQAGFQLKSRRGWMESDLLSSFGVTLADLEPKAENCTKVLVWHTRTEKPDLKNEDKLRLKGEKQSDPSIEV